MSVLDHYERQCKPHRRKLNDDMRCRRCRGEASAWIVVNLHSGEITFDSETDDGIEPKGAKPPRTEFRWPAPLGAVPETASGSSLRSSGGGSGRAED